MAKLLSFCKHRWWLSSKACRVDIRRLRLVLKDPRTLELSYANRPQGLKPTHNLGFWGRQEPARHKASLPQATKPVSLCKDLAATCTSSQFIPVSFSLTSPWGLIDGDERQSIAVWQNVYYQPSRKWLLWGNFEPPDYDAVSHILNCSEQCIKVLQGDLVFHSLLGKEHTGVNWFQGKASTEDSNSLHPALWKKQRIKLWVCMAKGNTHFIPLDCSGGDPTANATETPDSVIRTTKAPRPCHICPQKLDGFLLASPTIITEAGFLRGTSFFTNLSFVWKFLKG